MIQIQIQIVRSALSLVEKQISYLEMMLFWAIASLLALHPFQGIILGYFCVNDHLSEVKASDYLLVLPSLRC